MLTKGYSHLDGFSQWCGNDCDDVDDHDGDDDDGDDEYDDVDMEGDDARDDTYDAPDNILFGNEGGNATSMCFTIQFNLTWA